MDDDAETRRARWSGLVGLALTSVWNRTVRIGSGRERATVAAVGLTVALLLVVTGVSLGLAEGASADGTDADVRITPESSESLSNLHAVEGARLGDANERAAAVADAADVDHASPVLVEPLRLESPDGDVHTVHVVGVVPDEESRTVAGLPTTALEAGDADGNYEGPPSGEIVLSEGAADRLGASTDDELGVRTTWAAARGVDDRAVTVADVTAGADGEAPVALAHLSELQALSGAGDAELADRVLVWGNDDAAASAAADGYPDATVEVTGEPSPAALFDDELAFATSLLAMVVGVAICASLVATTAGMTVEEERRTLAVLEAVGTPGRSRLAVVATTTLATTLCGALVGLVVGVLGTVALDAVAGATVASETVAAVHPLFVPYALVVALVAGLIALPYPLAVASRTTVLEEVGR